MKIVIMNEAGEREEIDAEMNGEVTVEELTMDAEIHWADGDHHIPRPERSDNKVTRSFAISQGDVYYLFRS